MALQRRTLLQVATAVGLGLAGCSSIGGTDGTNTATPTDSVDTNTGAEEIHVVVHNQLSEAVTVAVTLSTDQPVLVDDEMTIAANEFTGFDTGIDETGHYRLEVPLDDRETEITFEVDDHDLERGPNILFWIDEDEIRYGIED